MIRKCFCYTKRKKTYKKMSGFVTADDFIVLPNYVIDFLLKLNKVDILVVYLCNNRITKKHLIV